MTLNAFAQRIKRIAERIPKNVDKAVQQTAIAIDQSLVLSTPVDTGRARANWQIGIGAPELSELDVEDKDGQGTISKNNGRIANRKIGQDIFINNNLPYILPLNAGSSAQAPANFVEKAVKLGSRVVANAKVIS